MSRVRAELNMRVIHPYASYCSVSGIFSYGCLPHSVGRARHACVCFVARLHSVKARYSALNAALRSGRELNERPVSGVEALQMIAGVESGVDVQWRPNLGV